MGWALFFLLCAHVAEWILALLSIVGIGAFIWQRDYVKVFIPSPWHWLLFVAVVAFAVLFFCDGMAGTIKLYEAHRLGRLF